MNENIDYSKIKEFYIRYVMQVRNVKRISAEKYCGALNSISTILMKKKLIKNSIFEVEEPSCLEFLYKNIFIDKEFIDKDKKGNNMYSVALKHYMQFFYAEGFDTGSIKQEIMDKPIMIGSQITTSVTSWQRSPIIKEQAIKFANYKCEINSEHNTFIAQKNMHPYMEGHHSIPMKYQNRFDVNLDAHSNILCLCPICHRKMHYGVKDDIRELALEIYSKRSERLANSGIRLSQNEFIDYSLNQI